MVQGQWVGSRLDLGLELVIERDHGYGPGSLARSEEISVDLYRCHRVCLFLCTVLVNELNRVDLLGRAGQGARIVGRCLSSLDLMVEGRMSVYAMSRLRSLVCGRLFWEAFATLICRRHVGATEVFSAVKEVDRIYSAAESLVFLVWVIFGDLVRSLEVVWCPGFSPVLHTEIVNVFVWVSVDDRCVEASIFSEAIERGQETARSCLEGEDFLIVCDRLAVSGFDSSERAHWWAVCMNLCRLFCDHLFLVDRHSMCLPDPLCLALDSV